MVKCVDPHFFDIEIYSIYHTIYEFLGERTWEVVWRSGEVLYNIVKKELNLTSVTDVFKAVEEVVSWLKRVGYVDDINVKKVSEDIIEYVMSRPIILDSAERLIKEGRVPPHISTALLFALLKDYGYKAEMIGEPTFLKDGKAVERWRLIKI